MTGRVASRTHVTALQLIAALIGGLTAQECHEHVIVPYGSKLLRAFITALRPIPRPDLRPTPHTTLKRMQRLQRIQSLVQCAALLHVWALRALHALLAHGQALGMVGGAPVPARGVGHPNRYALAVEECAPDALSVIESLHLSDETYIAASASLLLCRHFDVESADLHSAD